jgi:hypothetical protein
MDIASITADNRKNPAQYEVNEEINLETEPKHMLSGCHETWKGMKNGVFWDVTPRGCCKNRSFGGT